MPASRQINLAVIKFRSFVQEASGPIDILATPAAQAYALPGDLSSLPEGVPPLPEDSENNPPVIENNTDTLHPFVRISVTSQATATASVVAQTITSDNTVHSIIAPYAWVIAYIEFGIASLRPPPIIKISVTAVGVATASSVSPVIITNTQTISASPAIANANISHHTVTGVTVTFVKELTFPEVDTAPLWAGNMIGQDYDDTMEHR